MNVYRARKRKSKIQATEMNYLRWVTRVTRKNRIRREQIREEVKTEPELEYIDTEWTISGIWEPKISIRREGEDQNKQRSQ